MGAEEIQLIDANQDNYWEEYLTNRSVFVEFKEMTADSLSQNTPDQLPTNSWRITLDSAYCDL